MSEVYDGFLGYTDPMPSGIPVIKADKEVTDIPKKDMVNHPPHYQSKSGLEVIDVIDAFTEELWGCEAIYTGHILRYTLRWKQKNGLEDLKKAQWYLNRLISLVEKEKQNEVK